ncbi:MAG: phosphoribosyltransferase [uncultured bacterium]|nr:MAG: phosphoribosyltransferase [uncultured bacterium]
MILALPVASTEALEKVQNEASECIVLEVPEYFQSVGQFYYQFEPVEDEEVIQLLN